MPLLWVVTRQRKTLIGAEASLQLICNREGFNVMLDSSSAEKSRIRIGIVSKNEIDNCVSYDSIIRFGAEDTMMTPYGAEETMTTNISKSWDIFCFPLSEGVF